MTEAIAAVEEGFAALSTGRATVPIRTSLPIAGDAIALSMPASIAGGRYWTVKLVTVAPGNTARGLPLIAATVLLGDAATGLPLALLDGTSLTALRTGAAGGVAAKHLARPDSRVVALFGAGAQARTQAEAVATVLGERLRELRVVARDPAHAERLAGEAKRTLGVEARASDAEGALRGASIVVTATSSASPVFDGATLGEGVHITAVGSFKPTMRELDDATLSGARIFVDQREAALHEAGELQGRAPDEIVEIGEVIAARAPGRRSASERTVFKSVGNAVQDLVVAARAYERARELGLGEETRWP